MTIKFNKLLYENSDGSYYSFQQIINLGRRIPLPFTIEKHRGTKMRWNQDEYSPFDYGDVINHFNPADDMEWDIIIAPDSKASDNNLLISGVIRISDDAEKIPYPHGNMKGNHKLILSQDGKLTPKDKQLLTDYFHGNNAFLKPDFFDERGFEKIIKEDWESSTMKKMKLGHFNNGAYQGIAVGPTARHYVGAKKFKNRMFRTNSNSTLS